MTSSFDWQPSWQKLAILLTFVFVFLIGRRLRLLQACAPLQSISASAQYRIALKVGIMIRRGYEFSTQISGGELANNKTAIQPIMSAAIDAGTNNTGQRHDQLATGRKLRVLTIIDTFSRFSPAIEPRFSFRGPDVVEILEEVGRQVGFPKAIRVDQGTEFVSRDLDLWAYRLGVTLAIVSGRTLNGQRASNA
jgi:transposase InsO family protein